MIASMTLITSIQSQGVPTRGPMIVP
jgi:phosphoglucomutase